MLDHINVPVVISVLYGNGLLKNASSFVAQPINPSVRDNEIVPCINAVKVGVTEEVKPDVKPVVKGDVGKQEANLSLGNLGDMKFTKFTIYRLKTMKFSIYKASKVSKVQLTCR